MSIQPLHIENKLSKDYLVTPRFSLNAKLKSGETLSLPDPKAIRALVALMDMQAVMGGAASHWGGPAAFAELMSAAHGYMFHVAKTKGGAWFDHFHFVNDAGHCENGLYALKANYEMANLNIEKLKGFRSIESRLTGHGEAHLFPQGVYISNGPLGSALAQAQGLAAADAIVKSSRVTMVAISDGACMEGEAREALASIPGLAKNNKLAPFVMIVSDNNTKLSGRIDTDAFSMSPTFSSLKELGWEVLHLELGNDLPSCLHAIESAVEMASRTPGKPVAIHAKTIKGFGVKSTESSNSGGHGFPVKHPKDLKAFLQEIYSEESLPEIMLQWCESMVGEAQNKEQKSANRKEEASSVVLNTPSEKVQVGVAKALIEMRTQGYPIISVTSDLPDSTGVGNFRKAFPDEQLDVGVAESNMISLAIGLSKQGFIPVVDTFAQFGVTKGALPLIMSALSQGPVIAIFSHAGFQDAADGASHQALSYFAMTSAIPHTDTYVLSCSGEAEKLVAQAIKDFASDRRAGRVPHSKIFFLGRENFPRWIQSEDETYKLGKASIVLDNSLQFEKCITMVATGAPLFNCLAAAETLVQKSIGSIIVNPGRINSVDIEPFEVALKKSEGRILTVEDHQVVGGMGALITHALAQVGLIKKVKSLGVAGEFGQSAYTAEDLYIKHKLDRASIAKAAEDLLL